jgi:hypothetical protein
MGRVSRIVRRNRARAVGRDSAFLDAVRLEAFMHGFLAGRRYEKSFREGNGEERSGGSGDRDSPGTAGSG